MHPDYEAIIVNVPKLLNIDFSSLNHPVMVTYLKPNYNNSVYDSWQLVQSSAL